MKRLASSLSKMATSVRWVEVFTTEIKNATAWHLGMKELTSAGNEIAKLLLEDLVPSLEGAHVGKLYLGIEVFLRS